MFARPHIHQNSLPAVPPAALPVAQLVIGKPVVEVAALLPRLFNLCRAAQTVAVRMALGLVLKDRLDAEIQILCEEIKREHLLRLAVILPTRLGLPPLRIPSCNGEITQALFGATRFPETPQAFEIFIVSDKGIAPCLRAIANRFDAGDANSGLLPPFAEAALFDNVAMENSVAARHLDHPVLYHIEAQFGRGPLWRTLARAVDLQAVLQGDLPAPRLTPDGVALVPAARGIYAVKARSRAGKVTHFQRATPTDHMLAPNGIMQRSLATLPAAKHDQAGLLADILDPCCPLELKGVADA